MSFLDISSGPFCGLVERLVNASGIEATDCGRDLMEPGPRDVGRWFQDKVPLLDSEVAFAGAPGTGDLSGEG